MNQDRDGTEIFIFETNKVNADSYLSYYFTKPKRIFYLRKNQDVHKFFSEIEHFSKKYYLAGFFSYELGYVMEKAFNLKGFSSRSSFPLAVMMVFDEPAVYDHRKEKFVRGFFSYPDYSGYEMKKMKLMIDKKRYCRKLKKIKRHIVEGDTYQLNFTSKYMFDFNGNPLDLYRDLKGQQGASYNVFMRFEDYSIVSISPELFFYRNRDFIKVKPMKGTVGRGMNPEEDFKNRVFLKNDGKNQSENVMIVDLLRNDLNRISNYGTVSVKNLFEIEEYKTLFQMTSTIESKLKRNVSLFDILKNIFPSGSVTGAPKINSMKILRELEENDRKIYCGALGFMTPAGESRFNVAIRTLLLKNSKGEMGVGGGIVNDSNCEDEYEELKTKARFLIMKENEKFQNN